MTDPVQLALVGLGRMGSVHANALAALDEIDVVAAADPSGDARAVAAVLFPTARLLADPADAFELSGVEACVLATPTPLHPQQVRAAIDAGLHARAKPPSCSIPADSPRARPAATRAGRDPDLGFWRRYAPPWRVAKAMLDRGTGVPGVPSAPWRWLSQWDADPPPASFCDPSVSGGLAIDCGVHEYDLAEWLSGRNVVRVRAYAAPHRRASRWRRCRRCRQPRRRARARRRCGRHGRPVAQLPVRRRRAHRDPRLERRTAHRPAAERARPPRERLAGMIDLDDVSVARRDGGGCRRSGRRLRRSHDPRHRPGRPRARWPAPRRATLIGHAVHDSIRTGAAVDIEPIGAP